jgi:hypothetical protein
MANEEVPLDLTGVPDNTLITGWYDKRVAAYQELNQDEMRYDDMVNGTNTWGEAIESIKLAHPKPTGE